MKTELDILRQYLQHILTVTERRSMATGIRIGMAEPGTTIELHDQEACETAEFVRNHCCPDKELTFTAPMDCNYVQGVREDLIEPCICQGTGVVEERKNPHETQPD